MHNRLHGIVVRPPPLTNWVAKSCFRLHNIVGFKRRITWDTRGFAICFASIVIRPMYSGLGTQVEVVMYYFVMLNALV